NCTLLNSEPPKLAKVIVRDEPELKTTVPVPADHDPLVDEFVHEPAKFQVVAPKPKYPEAAMLTLPVIVFVPAAPPVIPPAMFAARVATVSVKVPRLPTPGAPPVRPRLAVARAVVEEPSEIVSVPPQIRALVDMVNV